MIQVGLMVLGLYGMVVGDTKAAKLCGFIAFLLALAAFIVKTGA